jgi:hypothetical protein
MPYRLPRDLHIIRGLEDFGAAFVDARTRILMSQRYLAERSGVSQSSVSRVERALAPSLALDRVISMGLVLGNELPLGRCPHDHPCRWQPRVSPMQGSRTRAGILSLLLDS